MHLFIGTEYTHGVSIDSCTLEGPRRFWDTDNGNGTGSINRGSYSIRADYTTSLAIKNITQTNLYSDDFTTAYDKTSDGMMDHNAIMGSNFCKNMLFEGNKMSTFDSHMDIYNLTFRNNEVERINIVGSGTVYIEDSIIHAGNTGAVVTLREDYNSNFKGDVYFKNVTVETYSNNYIVFLPIVGLIIGRIVKKLRHPAKRSQERMADMVSMLDESLSGMKIVKGYNATKFIINKFKSINKHFSELVISMAKRQQLASPMSEFLGITAVAIILVFGGTLVEKDLITGAGFIAFIAAFSQITRPLRSFIDQFANINQGVAAGERIFTIIDAESEVKDKEDAEEFEGLKESIELRNVHFSYDGEREVINDATITIKKGQTIALVGPSGGGKSTLSELIPRFYDVTSGEILFDGKSIKDYTQESLRSNMSIVSQETVLFNDSIEGNILMGRPTATHDEVVEACKVANAHGFITEAPEGYDTNIGDRGTKLSGGQRQRLSIARAVLKNPEILILDEATSALDTESEKLVQDALTNLLKGRTSIVIAHRLSTIYNADRIYVIDQGRVAEQGTHSELLEKGGIYAHLIEMQSFS